jgi:hypothetical protein
VSTLSISLCNSNNSVLKDADASPTVTSHHVNPLMKAVLMGLVEGCCWCPFVLARKRALCWVTVLADNLILNQLAVKRVLICCNKIWNHRRITLYSTRDRECLCTIYWGATFRHMAPIALHSDSTYFITSSCREQLLALYNF